LGAFDGLLEALEQELEVVAALDEVDVGGVDDQEVGSGVAEEEMFVGAGRLSSMYSGAMWDSSREAFLAMRARRTSGLAWR